MRPGLLVLAALLVACGPLVGTDEGSGTGDTGSDAGSVDGGVTSGATTVGTTGSASGSSSVGTSGSTTVGTSEAGSEGEDCPDYPKFDIGPPSSECDVLAQDCGSGFKCAPEPNGGHYAVCHMLPADPLAPGDPCEAYQQFDPCDATSVCGLVDRSGIGTCIEQCAGTADDPVCPMDTICVLAWFDAYALCLPPCYPFDDMPCPEGTSCTPSPHGFGCVPDGRATSGSWCAEASSCAEQYACVAGEQVPGCCDPTCCTPMCDPAGGPACPDGLLCVALDPPVPGAGVLGACVAP